MGIKPIHKAIKKFQSVNTVLTERCWSCFLEDDDYFMAIIRNDMSESTDFLTFLDAQKANLLPSELVRQMRLL